MLENFPAHGKLTDLKNIAMQARLNLVEEADPLRKSVFVVIPVHNRIAYTRSCLASFQQQDTNNFKVIVVDDGSKDGTSEMIRLEFPDTILLKGDGNLWWAGSINKGIRHALTVCKESDFILVINDDLVISSDYVSSLMKAAESYPGSIIGSVETLKCTPSIIKSGGVSVNWKIAKQKVLNQGELLEKFPRDHIEEVNTLTGRGTLFPCQVFREVGLYDEIHFKQCGDTELPVRANFKFSYPLLISYNAVVISYPGSKNHINHKETYALSDFVEYFWGLRSNFNLNYRFWFGRNIAPSSVWLIRYLFFDTARIIGHFVTRLRF